MTIETLPTWLQRGVSEVFPAGSHKTSSQQLGIYLNECDRPMRVKLGIDPTASEIHLGHSLLFRKLREFQDAGHTAVLIIGDFTARIGDPTGKSRTRVQLSSDVINENCSTYLKQLGQGKDSKDSILDFNTSGRLEIHYNSEWFSNLNLESIINLLSVSTVNQMLAKEDFNRRYSSGVSINLHEFLYPLLQGYDSVMIKSDIELGGTDQKFNIAVGRDLQHHFGQLPQFGMLLPILPGLDGTQKMSKSLGNTISLNEDAISMYSKLEKIPDSVVDLYLSLLTKLDLKIISNDSRERQKIMALEITSQYHGETAAIEAQKGSERLVSGFVGNDIKMSNFSLTEINFPAKAFYLVRSVLPEITGNEAKRKIQEGCVRINGTKILDPNQIFNHQDELNEKVLQFGKKIFRRLTIN